MPVEIGSITGSVGAGPVYLRQATRQGGVICIGCWGSGEKATIPCERRPRTGESLSGGVWLLPAWVRSEVTTIKSKGSAVH